MDRRQEGGEARKLSDYHPAIPAPPAADDSQAIIGKPCRALNRSRLSNLPFKGVNDKRLTSMVYCAYEKEVFIPCQNR